MNGIRHLGPKSVYETAIEVLDNHHIDLVGFGLAGDELHFPPNLFVKTFDMLKKNNFPITIHAGEWDGPERIRDAINLLHPARLGHGVRSIEDPKLVDQIKEGFDVAYGKFKTRKQKMKLILPVHDSKSLHFNYPYGSEILDSQAPGAKR